MNKFKTKRKIILYGNSRAITIPESFCVMEEYVVQRRIDDIILITPYSKDLEMVLSDDLMNKLKLLMKKIEIEKHYLKELEVLKKAYKQSPDKGILNKIKELERRLDQFRLSSHDEI